MYKYTSRWDLEPEKSSLQGEDGEILGVPLFHHHFGSCFRCILFINSNWICLQLSLFVFYFPCNIAIENDIGNPSKEIQ